MEKDVPVKHQALISKYSSEQGILPGKKKVNS